MTLIFELPKIKPGDGIRSGKDWLAVRKVNITGLFCWNLDEKGNPVDCVILRSAIPRAVDALYRAGDIIWKKPVS